VFFVVARGVEIFLSLRRAKPCGNLETTQREPSAFIRNNKPNIREILTEKRVDKASKLCYNLINKKDG